jgi:DNA mismatch endonuclease (patch repair protein)
VGPKTASAVRVFGFERPAIPVDTHIHRVVNRLGAVSTSTLEETQERLADVVPYRYWGRLNPVLVQHGQNICIALSPRCAICPITEWCDFGKLNARSGGTDATAAQGKRARVLSDRTDFLRDGRSPLPDAVRTSRVMSANRGRNTGPELTFRAALRAAGLKGYRLHPLGTHGRPDVAFIGRRVAVFVHGCFWHRCPRCALPLPKSHTEFWREKFRRNEARDVRKEALLRDAGWRVIVVWECEIRDQLGATVEKVRRAVALVPGTRRTSVLAGRKGSAGVN